MGEPKLERVRRDLQKRLQAVRSHSEWRDMMHEGAMITIQAIGDDQEPHELARAIMLEIDDAVARRALGEG